MYNTAMGILLPAALGLLALAVPIILFYMLRLRRVDYSVSSSYLWRRALLDRTANMPWNRLRRNLLLLLQLLLLVLLVLTLARPYFTANTVASGNIVVVLDASASMQTTDETAGRSRFERARDEATTLAGSLDGNAQMAIIWAGPSPQVALAPSSNKAGIEQAISKLEASNGTTDMGQAVTLAAGIARQMGDSTVVLISDGAFAGADSLPQMPGKSAYINVGKSAANVGITALSLRSSTSGPQLFAAVRNSGPQPVSALLNFYVDDKLHDARKLSIKAGEEQSVSIQGLPLNMHTAEARLQVDDKSANALGADDRAWAVLGGPPQQSVLLVTEGNSFLEKSLKLLPNVKLSETAPSRYGPTNNFGLTVLDGFMPDKLPGGNLLILNPSNSALVPVSGTLAYPALGQVAVNDPLLRFVDLTGVHIAAAARISPQPPWARSLLSTPTGDPLIMVGETAGRRVAVIAFDLHKSDLPLQIAFPILIANLVDWLQPSSAVDVPPALAAGDAVSIRPLPEADEVRVTIPGDAGAGGRQTTLHPSPTLSFADTGTLGIYSVQQFAGGKPLSDPEQFAVNMPRDEGEIAPRLNITFSGAQTATNDQATRAIEIWPWVLVLGLILLTIEWWYYNRGGRLMPIRLGGTKR